MDIDPRVDVRLFAGQEQRLEVGDLLAMDIGNAAGAVGGVFELCIDDDLATRSGCFDATGRPDTGGSSTYDERPSSHRRTLPRPLIFTIRKPCPLSCTLAGGLSTGSY
jgi:hypothetical protein